MVARAKGPNNEGLKLRMSSSLRTQKTHSNHKGLEGVSVADVSIIYPTGPKELINLFNVGKRLKHHAQNGGPY